MSNHFRSLTGRVLNVAGVPASRKFALKRISHRLGLSYEPTVWVPEKLRDIVKNGFDLLAQFQGSAARGNVLFWSVRDSLFSNSVEGLLAHALNLRGARSHIFLCDKLLPACDNRVITSYPKKRVTPRVNGSICDVCYFHSAKVFNALQLPVYTFSEFVTQSDIQQAREFAQSLPAEDYFRFRYRGLNLGQMVHSSVVRFFLRGDASDDPKTQDLARNYVEAAVLLTEVCRKVFERFDPSCVFTSHGIYVSWGIITEYARCQKVPLVVWAKGYRHRAVILSHGRTYLQELLPASEDWPSSKLSSAQSSQLQEYLLSRRKGSTFHYFSYSLENKNRITEIVGLDKSKKTVAVFPNLVWDACVRYGSEIFSSVPEWILATVERFLKRPGYQLVIRAHPLERQGVKESQQKISDVIAQRFPDLPAHVKVIPAHSEVSSYALAEMADIAVVYGSQIGLELAALGKPVIVVVDAFYRGKGFTHDVTSREEYFALLDGKDSFPSITPDLIERARAYAYYFFFRRNIPCTLVEESKQGSVASIPVNSLHELLPGKDPYLDFMSDGILERRPFALDPKLVVP